MRTIIIFLIKMNVNINKSRQFAMPAAIMPTFTY
jgi:hypothetical protein